VNKYISLFALSIAIYLNCNANQICTDSKLKQYINEDKSVKDSVQLVQHLNTKINEFKASNNFYCWLSYTLNFADKYFQLEDYYWHINELSRIIKSSFFQQYLEKEYLTKDEAIKICKAYGKKAWYHYQLSEYNLVKNDLEQIEKIFLKHKLSIQDFDLAEYCYKSLSPIYIRLGDNKRAISIAQKALKLIHSYNDLNRKEPYDEDQVVDHYQNFARAYNNFAKYDSALLWINKGLSKKVSSSHYIDLVLLKLEVITEKIKDEYTARTNELTFNSQYLDSFNQTTSIVEPVLKQINNEQKAEYAYVMAYLKSLENPPNLQAVKYWFEKRLKLSQKIYQPNSREIAKNQGYVGHSYLDINEIDSAKYHFYLGLQTILPDFNPSQNPLPNKDLFFNENAIFENLEGLAKVFTLQDSLELALQAYELSFHVKLNLRSIYDFESSKLYLQQKAKEINSQAIEVAWQLYKKTTDEQYIQRAFKIAESSRALVLLENIAKNQLLKQAENADSLFAEQKAKFDKPISLAELRSHLSENETILEYFQANDILYAFEIENNNPPHFYKLTPNLQQLEQLLETLRIPNNSANAIDLFKNLANKLYEDILAPLQILSRKNLIIIPDGQFNYLPFEVLLTQGTNEKSFKKLPYLLKDHIVSYQYSATIFSRLNQQSNQAQLNKVLSITPVFENTDYTLSASKEEVNEIRAIFPSDALMRELASKENILNKINQYNILHFSTHASSGDQVAKEEAHIVLHQDTLYLNEIYQQPIQANLVTLSACETNLGKYEGGEGVMSLSRAFAYAGCPSLVSTLWQVNDQSTKNIIVQFYQNIKQGNAKDEALQQAKLAYFGKNDDAHPYYWASFVAIGNMQPLENRRNTSWKNYLWLLFPLTIGTYFLSKIANRNTRV